MGHRIRALEDALAIFQAGVSADVHPLLTDELLGVKYGLETTPRDAAADHQALPIDGLGTLTITEEGDSHYFGRTAGSEVTLMVISWVRNANGDMRLFAQTLFLVGCVYSRCTVS